MIINWGKTCKRFSCQGWKCANMRLMRYWGDWMEALMEMDFSGHLLEDGGATVNRLSPSLHKSLLSYRYESMYNEKWLNTIVFW